MRKKVLIVDDEFDILDVLDRFFKRRNAFEVVKTNNPMDALNIIKNDNIDLVLTDIMMPQLDGVELLKKVKHFRTSIKVIMMTAYSTMDRVLECEEAGADDYVTKPFISLKDVELKVLDLLNL